MNASPLNALLNLLQPILAIGLMIMVLRAVTRGRHWPKHAACAACAYEITRPIPERCPECGSNVLSAGIISRRLALRLRGNGYAAAIAWFILLLGIVGPGADARIRSAFRRGPSPVSWTINKSFTLSPADQSLTGAPPPIFSDDYSVDVQIDAETTGMGLAAFQGTITANVQQQGKTLLTFTGNPAKSEWIVSGPSGSAPRVFRGLDQPTVLAQFETAGLKTTAPGMSKEADLLAKVLSATFTNPESAFVAATSSSSPQSPGGLNVSKMVVKPAVMSPNTAIAGYSGAAAETFIAWIVFGPIVLLWSVGVWWGYRRRAHWLRLME